MPVTNTPKTFASSGQVGPDLRSVSPLYAQARAKIEEMITERNLSANDQLPTVRQISATIGISRATTSKAIIGMIEEGILAGRQGKGVFLNYRPEQPVRSELKTVYVLSGGKPTFGEFENYLVHTPFWNAIVTGIRQGFAAGHEAIRLRFAMLPQFVAEEDVVPRKRRWDEIGFIIMTDPTPENFEKILRLKTSVVLVHGRRNAESVATINTDFIQGTEMIVDHLVGLGHRNIFFCGETQINKYNTGGIDLEKVAGFRKAMARHGLPADDNRNVRSCPYGTEEGYQAAQMILAQKDRPTALVMGNDELAIGAIRAIREAGLNVPGDISVAGFDNIPIGRFICPSLTTVATRMQELGRLSVQKLFNVHDGGSPDPVCLKPELIVRESTGPVKPV